MNESDGLQTLREVQLGTKVAAAAATARMTRTLTKESQGYSCTLSTKQTAKSTRKKLKTRSKLASLFFAVVAPCRPAIHPLKKMNQKVGSRRRFPERGAASMVEARLWVELVCAAAG